MSVSARILLFAVVVIGITCVLSGSSLSGARTGRQIRERVVASQEQLASLDRLTDGVWPYLNALSRAREQGQDTRPILQEREAQVLAELRRLDVQAEQEQRKIDSDEDFTPRDREQEEFGQAIQVLLLWMKRTEERLRSKPDKGPIPPALEWELYQDYARQAGRYLSSLEAAEREELSRLRERWDASMGRSERLAELTTLGCVVLMVALALAILVPLQRALRGLRAAAERVGRGDFEVALPALGGDELGLLAHAMNRMASELRGTLQEKQRLMKAEAEVSEREARRYSAMLEETVRARTAELETANVRLEESFRQLQAAQDQLLFADRLATVGKLAAGVGHEINNPLSYVLSNLRFLQGGLGQKEAAALPEYEELRTATTEAYEGAERIRLIVQELRLLSRPDDVALGPVELAGVIQGAAKLAAQELRHRARLVEECEDVPVVWGNGPRLGQVVLNLLINAAHAIAPGREAENEVRVVARACGSASVTLEVCDTGCGIPRENLERIFEPFFTTKAIGVGTGLGLSVCRNLISSMGGTIQVESHVGRGTTFRITLPRAEGQGGGRGLEMQIA